MAQVAVAEAAHAGGGPYKKILVAVDGSEASLRAARAAINLASLMGAKLVVLSVVELPLLVDQTPAGSQLGVGYYLEEARRQLERVVAGVAEEAARQGVEAERVVVEGATSVVQAITEKASERGVDLIVVGTRGLGGFKRLLLGSVSSGVVSHAHCSVLVVR